MVGSSQVIVEGFYIICQVVEEVGVLVGLIGVGVEIIEGNYIKFGVQAVFDQLGYECQLII